MHRLLELLPRGRRHQAVVDDLVAGVDELSEQVDDLAELARELAEYAAAEPDHDSL